MLRLLIMCRRPFHLSRIEAELWMKEQAALLLADRVVERVSVASLRSARGPRHADWLIELELVDGADVDDAVDGGACRDLLGDLHLLGMRPTVCVIEETRDIGTER